MTEPDDLDRLLTAWFAVDAPMREPEPLLGQVLARTVRTRRRPAWRIPERWLPMSTIATRVEGASRFPWRSVAIGALLVVALTLGALVFVGSRAKPVPAPFGPAHNGQILYSMNGDIVAIDSPGAAPTTILSGDTFDSGPMFSPDGLRFLFVRGAMDTERTASGMDRRLTSSAAELWAADADGSNPRRLAATPYIGWVAWSPQADVIAVSIDTDKSIIRMVKTDGSGSTDINTGVQVAEDPTFRPSDDKQLTFRGKAHDGTWGLYVIGRDGSGMQRLELDPGFASDDFYAENRDDYFLSPVWSPDGRRLMYHTLEPHPESPAGPGFRIHIADVSATGVITAERTLEFDRSADDEFDAAWLPSGGGIIYQSLEGQDHRELTADLAAGSKARDLGVNTTDYIRYLLSPDGRQVVVTVPSVSPGRAWWSVIDLATLDLTHLGAAGDDMVWQRTAP